MYTKALILQGLKLTVFQQKRCWVIWITRANQHHLLHNNYPCVCFTLKTKVFIKAVCPHSQSTEFCTAWANTQGELFENERCNQTHWLIKLSTHCVLQSILSWVPGTLLSALLLLQAPGEAPQQRPISRKPRLPTPLSLMEWWLHLQSLLARIKGIAGGEILFYALFLNQLKSTRYS